jgi:hypothetical protein
LSKKVLLVGTLYCPDAMLEDEPDDVLGVTEFGRVSNDAVTRLGESSNISFQDVASIVAVSTH